MQLGETQVESPRQPLPDEKFVPNQLRQTATKTGFDLAWADAEDKLSGAITPLAPMAGEPMTISVRVGTFEGKDFDGPVRFVMRAEDEPPMEQLVKREPGERAWVAKFTPQNEGRHTIDVSFSSSRNKVLTGAFEVQGGKMPRWPWYIFAAVLIAGGITAGVRFAKREG